MAFLVLGAAFSYSQKASFYLYSPEGGERYNYGDIVGVKYGADNPDILKEYGRAILFDYTSDGGKSWTNFNKMEPGSDYFEWEISKDLSSGTYQIRIYESNGEDEKPTHRTATSNEFYIGKEQQCLPANIFSQPQSVRACSGEGIALSVKTDAQDGARYIWYKDFKEYTVVDQPYIYLGEASPELAGDYFVVVEQPCGERAQSDVATVSTGNAVRITTQPIAKVSLCENGRVTLRAEATGDDLWFQWRKNGTAIPNANSNTFVIEPARPSDAAAYDLVVSGSCGLPETSSRTDVGVFAQPVILDKPVSGTVCAGLPLSLSVSASGAGLQYQWYKNDQAILGATTSTFTIPSVRVSDEGNYHVMVATGAAAPAECAMTISVDPVLISVYKAPVITASPVNTIGCAGGEATFLVEVEGFGLTYQWFKNGSPIKNATSYALTLSHLTAADAGNYSVSVTGTCGLPAQTNPATLTVNAAPSIVTAPSDQTVELGSTIVLEAKITVDSPVQWYRNAVAVPGATTARFEIPNAKVENSGIYYAVFRGICGGIVTGPARVTVNDPSSNLPVITLAASSVDLGEIPTGYSAEKTIDQMITNTGKSNLEITGLAVANPAFALVDAPAMPLNIAVGQSVTIKIRANAGPVGDFSTTLVITSNTAVGMDNVAVTAKSVLRYSHPATVTAATIEETKSTEKCFDIVNTSSVEITIDDFAITGLNLDQFAMITAKPLVIAANATSNVCVRFAPTEEGVKSAMLMITSSTGGNSSLALSGEATDLVSSVDEELQGEFSVYPNPSTGSVKINAGGNEILKAVVVSSFGTIVNTLDPSSSAWNGTSVDGQQVSSGMYTLVITTARGVVSLPVVINR